MNRRAAIARGVIAAGAGLLFGAGLTLSQMIDPLKVLRFLDFGAIGSGGWDPSLAFVIGPAILIMFLGVRISRRLQVPLADDRFHPPPFTHIDAPLLVGAALFGIGWGMSGICPGPAIALLAFMPEHLPIYLAGLLAGTLAGGVIGRRLGADAGDD